MSASDRKQWSEHTHTFTTDVPGWPDASHWQWGYGRSDGPMDNYTARDLQKIFEYEATTTIENVAPDTPQCFVCESEYARDSETPADDPNICPLCRQAILMFRQRLIEDMLAEMAE